MSNVLENLTIGNALRNKEWDPEGKLTPLFFAAELAGEVGEACNIVKKLEREKLGLRGSTSSIEYLAAELADVIICTSLLANAYNIGLVDAVVKKFNDTSVKLGLSIKIGH